MWELWWARDLELPWGRERFDAGSSMELLSESACARFDAMVVGAGASSCCRSDGDVPAWWFLGS